MFYLKYRPKTLQDLDNTNVKDTLIKTLQSKKIPHALLFTGQKGTGKTSAARIFAKAVNCLENAFAGKGESIEPCNHCSNCKSIETSSSPDVIEMDAASNRGIDEIRSLIKESSFAPLSGRYRVFIIDEAHMITNDAFNALLKTLEEPSESVIFILATTNEEKVPKTIVSRCFKVLFGKAKKADILSRLEKIVEKEQIAVSKEVLEIIAQHADSSFRDANKLLEDLTIQQKLTPEKAQAYLGVQSKEDFLSILVSKSLADALKWINTFIESGGSPKFLIEDILQQLHSTLLSKSGIVNGTEQLNLSVGEISTLMRLFNEAYANSKLSPIESIPLEIAVVEFYNGRKTK